MFTSQSVDVLLFHSRCMMMHRSACRKHTGPRSFRGHNLQTTSKCHIRGFSISCTPLSTTSWICYDDEWGIPSSLIQPCPSDTWERPSGSFTVHAEGHESDRTTSEVGHSASQKSLTFSIWDGVWRCLGHPVSSLPALGHPKYLLFSVSSHCLCVGIWCASVFLKILKYFDSDSQNMQAKRKMSAQFFLLVPRFCQRE